MTGEEAAGPPGPKVLRLLYFVGAGILFTVGINKWRELERKSVQQEKRIHQQQKILSSANAAKVKTFTSEEQSALQLRTEFRGDEE